VELNTPNAYGHAAYDFTLGGGGGVGVGGGGGHSVVSSSDYIFRDGPAGPATAFTDPGDLPPDLYKSPSSNDYAYIQVPHAGRRNA